MNKKLMAVALATVAAGALVGFSAYGQSVRSVAILTDVKVPAKADNFQLVDQHSKAHELYYYKNAKAVVILSQVNGSKLVQDAAPAIKALKDKYAGQDVVFLMLNSSLNSSLTDAPKAVAAEMTKLGLDLPVLMDDAQLIGESLGVTREAQAFVIQPKTWNVVYNGPIDDRFAGKTAKPKAAVKTAYVADALDSLIAGKPVAVSTAKLESPVLAFPKRDRQADFAKISYSKEIAPLLAENCVSCHTEGGIAPFAMNSYEVVKGFAPMIREAIRTDRMPPFNADPHVGKFSNDLNLSTSEMQTLVHWIEAGAPRGEGEDLLKVSAKPAPDWELGEPDAIMELPAYTLPASGVVDYQYADVTFPVKETRWLKAVAFNIGERQGVHHIAAPMVEYGIGSETFVFPEGKGVEIAPNETLNLQLHYTPFGKEAVDKTKIGVYFYPKDKPPEFIYRRVGIANYSIEIPANTAGHQEVAYVTFPQDAKLYSVYPHAHYRGANARVYLKKPGGQEELIASTPRYNFNWQQQYTFETPLDVPAGTLLITRYDFDNSKNNPANPDPMKAITWGEQSWQEMQYTIATFVWKDETVANPKPKYMAELDDSRGFGMLDYNVDGKIAKAELRGEAGKVVLTKFDEVDKNKDGFLTDVEAAPLLANINNRIEQAIRDR